MLRLVHPSLMGINYDLIDQLIKLLYVSVAEELKLQYLSAYLDSLGTNSRHGANFATGGSTILPPGFSPFHLGIQISQFLQFKSRTTALYNQLSPIVSLSNPLSLTGSCVLKMLGNTTFCWY
jgi:hypothetical protein